MYKNLIALFKCRKYNGGRKSSNENKLWKCTNYMLEEYSIMKNASKEYNWMISKIYSMWNLINWLIIWILGQLIRCLVEWLCYFYKPKFVKQYNHSCMSSYFLSAFNSNDAPCCLVPSCKKLETWKLEIYAKFQKKLMSSLWDI